MAFRGQRKSVPHSVWGTEIALLEHLPGWKLVDISEAPAEFIDEYLARIEAESKAQPKPEKSKAGKR